jgi:hypothetical protein
VAAEMWNAILDYGETNKIIECLLSKYEVNRQSLEKDLELFIEDLKACGILEER